MRDISSMTLKLAFLLAVELEFANAAFFVANGSYNFRSFPSSRVFLQKAKSDSSSFSSRSVLPSQNGSSSSQIEQDAKTVASEAGLGKFSFPLPDLDLPDMKNLATISDNLPTSSNLQALFQESDKRQQIQLPTLSFDPSDPSTLISITKSFIATDFGIQTEQIPTYFTGPKKANSDENLSDAFPSSSSLSVRLPSTSSSSESSTTASSSSFPFYGASLLADSCLWISGNNLNDGRTGILNKNEYLAAGRFFNLRGSFPDLEYRPTDFRVYYDEADEYDDSRDSKQSDESTKNMKEITIRFTTHTTGTFRGKPLRLRSKLIPPNGKVMKCPPTSVSITYSVDKSDIDSYGKITKLVTDMVMDRQVGNTMGLSGIAAAAVIAGNPPGMLELYPPFVAVERFFARPMKPILDNDEDGATNLPPFPSSVMIQLAKGVTASYFGIDDADLLANEFTYIDQLLGPLDKDKYLQFFSSKYYIRDGIPNIDYQLQNYRVDAYNPYRVWVDTRPRGLRISEIGDFKLPKDVSSSMYRAPPEAMSFTFDDDGFCTRITGGAALDPLLGNTGGLAGVYGALYATGTPLNPLKSRTSNVFWNRVQKSILGNIGGVGVDGYKLSDGRVVNAVPSSDDKSTKQLKSAEPSSVVRPTPPRVPPKQASTTTQENESVPFFAKSKPTVTIPQVEKQASPPKKPLAPKPPATPRENKIQKDSSMSSVSISSDPADPVTQAFSSIFGTTDLTVASDSKRPSSESPPKSEITTKSTVQQLREAAQAARAEAAAAKQRAEEVKQQQAEEAKKTADVQMTENKKQSAAVSLLKESGESGSERGGIGGIFSLASGVTPTSSPQNASSKKAIKSALKSSKKTPDTSQRSPTFSLFGSSSSPPTSPPSASPKLLSKSPTQKAVKSSSSSTVKRSPTLSVFATSSKQAANARAAMSKAPKKKSSPSSSPKKSPTLSLFGTSSITKGSKGSTPYPPSASPTKAPTLSIFGGASKDSKSNIKKGKESKTRTTVKSNEMKKSPTFNIFPGSKSTSSKPLSQPNSPKKSSSFNIFSAKSSPASKAEKTATTKGAKPKPTISTPKDSPKASPKSADENATATNSLTNYFGNLFGRGSRINDSDASNKLSKSNSISREFNSVKVKAPPKGTPILKGWKSNLDGSITGLIYESGSFKDGTTVTTSSIKGKVSRGSVVQTTSGSKYFLE